MASDAATVTINVLENHAPAAVDDEYHVIAGATLKVDAAAETLTNDSDQDGGVLTAKLVSEPAGGSVTLKSDGSFTYTPDNGFFGTDSFTYVANDGSLDSSVATVTIHIRENHAPTAADDTFAVAEDGMLTVDAAAGVLANDADADGDALSANLVNRPAPRNIDLQRRRFLHLHPQRRLLWQRQFLVQGQRRPAAFRRGDGHGDGQPCERCAGGLWRRLLHGHEQPSRCDGHQRRAGQ